MQKERVKMKYYAFQNLSYLAIFHFSTGFSFLPVRFHCHSFCDKIILIHSKKRVLVIRASNAYAVLNVVNVGFQSNFVSCDRIKSTSKFSLMKFANSIIIYRRTKSHSHGFNQYLSEIHSSYSWIFDKQFLNVSSYQFLFLLYFQKFGHVLTKDYRKKIHLKGIYSEFLYNLNEIQKSSDVSNPLYWADRHESTVRSFSIEIYGSFERPCQDFRIHYCSLPLKKWPTKKLSQHSRKMTTNIRDKLSRQVIIQNITTYERKGSLC